MVTHVLNASHLDLGFFQGAPELALLTIVAPRHLYEPLLRVVHLDPRLFNATLIFFELFRVAALSMLPETTGVVVLLLTPRENASELFAG